MRNQSIKILGALGVALALAGCGGSDDGGQANNAAPRTTDVPASAQQSVAGLIAYFNELIAGTSESAEPVLVGDAVLPTSETAEPTN